MYILSLSLTIIMFESGVPAEAVPNLPLDAAAEQDNRAYLRERFIRIISSDVVVNKICNFRMFDNTTVSAVFVASDIHINTFAVRKLATKLGVLPHALLRRKDIISMHVRLNSSQEADGKTNKETNGINMNQLQCSRTTMQGRQQRADPRINMEQSQWSAESEWMVEQHQNPRERESLMERTQFQRQNRIESRSTLEGPRRLVEPRNTTEETRWFVEPEPMTERTQWSINRGPRTGEQATIMQRPKWPAEPGIMTERTHREVESGTAFERPLWPVKPGPGMEHTRTGGRSMARDISPLAAESPGLSCPDSPALRPDVCCNCSRKAEFMCSSCRMERYCSTQCQSERWLIHNTECGRLAQSQWLG